MSTTAVVDLFAPLPAFRFEDHVFTVLLHVHAHETLSPSQPHKLLKLTTIQGASAMVCYSDYLQP